MICAFARLALLGLAATASTASAAEVTDLSGHPVEYDLIAMAVQTQVEALVPVINKYADTDIPLDGSDWIKKFQASANAGTMTVQQNADDLNAFLSKAAAIDSSFPANARAALAKSTIDFFKVHTFMPEATWDIVDYGISNSGLSVNMTALTLVRKFMAGNAKTEKKAELQELVDTYIVAQEKTTPGFKSAAYKVLDTTYRAIWTKNPTRAPTASPSTSATITPSNSTATPTPTPTPTLTTKPTSGNSLGSGSGKDSETITQAPTVDPNLYIGEPMPVQESTSAPTTAPVPSATKSSAAASTVVSTAGMAVVSSLVVAMATTLL